jgi:alkylation response protein AidB-like acyl-CoA dehydrogenase
MDFSLSDEQIEFKQSTIAFAKQALTAGCREREAAGEFDRLGWKACADFGILGLPMPAKYGGLEKDVLTCIAALEGLGYACRDNGLLFAISSHIWTCESPILRFGSDAQKTKYLPGLIGGTLIGGHAMTEPGAGSDAFAMRTRAEKKSDRYVLTGRKMFISNAPIADVLIVFATTDATLGFGGLSAFLIERGTPGFSVGKPLEMMGLRTCPMGEVVLEDCEVPVENRLGKEGAGAAIFNSEMEWERSCLFAPHVGAMARDLETCVAYAKDRRQFGRSIGSNQAISHKIADMQVRLELARLVLYKVAWLKAKGKRAPAESAIGKLFISESYMTSCLDALQIHGAYGYSREFDFERNVRDAIASRIYSGTSEIQRNIIAAYLGLQDSGA